MPCRQRKVLVYGGRGALGRMCVSMFKRQNIWVCSIGHGPNEEADASIIVSSSQSWEEQSNQVQNHLTHILSGQKLDGIFNVAGGWAGGNAASETFINSCTLMWQQAVQTSVVTAQIAANHLNKRGIVVLSGALPAENGTPGMIGYGMCKASIHQLTRCLGEEGSGLPKGAHALCILPVTLDTPMNRKYMADADQTTWTPLEYVAQMFIGWLERRGRPVSGSLVEIVTEETVTTTETV